MNNKIRDLEFLLRREKMESGKKIRELLFQILDVYDGLQRLLQTVPQEEWPDSIKDVVAARFSLTGERLIQVLLRSGAIQINSLGQGYNSEYHEVLQKVYNPDVPEGNIVDVHSEGYIFEGEVIRMAKVVVATSDRNLEL